MCAWRRGQPFVDIWGLNTNLVTVNFSIAGNAKDRETSHLERIQVGKRMLIWPQIQLDTHVVGIEKASWDCMPGSWNDEGT